MKITKNAVASLAYTLTNDDGEIIDSSDADAPLAYIHGIGSLIPGLEKELEGKLAGDELTVHVAPADAYGERNDEMIHPVPRPFPPTTTSRRPTPSSRSGCSSRPRANTACTS